MNVSMQIGSIASAIAFFWGTSALAVPPLEVTEVYVDESGTPHQLIVTGNNFDNGNTIELWLGGVPLVVESTNFDPCCAVVANLPADMPDGSYQLVVATGGGAVRFDDFDGVTLRADGLSSDDPRVFARAWTVDSSSGMDLLIAQLVDANRDGVPSPGDEIYTSMYPKSLTAENFGEFLRTKHTVAHIDVVFRDNIGIIVSGPGVDPIQFRFQRVVYDSNTAICCFDQYYELDTATGMQTFLRDNFGTYDGPDQLDLHQDSPSRPGATSSETSAMPDYSDSGFLNVEINIE